ncbi:MAG: Hsp20/alpha crystallin family protein [Methanobacterium sp.]|jgi:HSP20 family protein
MSRKKKKEGIAESVIREFGFTSLLNIAKKSPTFEERLKEANEQIEERLRTGGERRSIPHIRSDFSIRTIVKDDTKRLKHPKIKKIKLDKLSEMEPLTDVFKERDKLKIIAELPGVEENDINLDLEENKLTISADRPDRKYYKEISLPVPVQADSLKSKYKNGILEVKLRRG